MQIGQRIRKQRKALGATLEQIAFEAGMDASNLSRIERGIQQPSSVLLQRIARALKVGVGEIYGDGKPDEHAGISDINRPTYSVDTRKFLKQYESLDEGNKTLALEFMRLLARRQNRVAE